MPTPHIEAPEGAYAKTVLMPGDPLRAKFIAETYLENPVQVTGVRNMLGFTGTYRGVPVSVQGSGMGCPSIGIYAYELYHFYGVEHIIRVGTAGSLREDLRIGDLVVALGACTDSNFAHQYRLPGTFAPTASFPLVRRAVELAEGKGLNCAVGNVLSSDVFYNDVSPNEDWRRMGVMAVEMESAALYMTAARAGKSAMTLLTVSDELLTHRESTSAQRQTAFTAMMEVALETAAALA